MSKPITQIGSLVNLIEQVRQAQQRYFAIKSGAIVGVTERERSKVLSTCKKLESELDEWISLYRADEARLRRWVASRILDSDNALEQGLGNLKQATTETPTNTGQ